MEELKQIEAKIIELSNKETLDSWDIAFLKELRDRREALLEDHDGSSEHDCHASAEDGCEACAALSK